VKPKKGADGMMRWQEEATRGTVEEEGIRERCEWISERLQVGRKCEE